MAMNSSRLKVAAFHKRQAAKLYCLIVTLKVMPKLFSAIYWLNNNTPLRIGRFVYDFELALLSYLNSLYDKWDQQTKDFENSLEV